MTPQDFFVIIPPVEGLQAEVTLECPLAVSPHVPQQDKPAGELFIADGALEGLLSGVVPYVIIQNVSSVECFGTICAFKFLQ